MTRVSRNSAWSSSGDTLPPLGFAAILPVAFQRCAQITATLGLIPYSSAASRRDAPASIDSITRSRKSFEYGFGIVPPEIESMPLDSLINESLGILPDSTRAENALAWISTEANRPNVKIA